ncbi:MAG: hypothetical protein MZV64_13535 [Ignavibacteriales bacterium]|nr:hypothetical protein [Ignavibacteriales bacterium]
MAVGFEQGSRTSFSFRIRVRPGEPLPALPATHGACRANTPIQRNDIFEDRINPHRSSADRPPVPAGAHRFGVR